MTADLSRLHIPDKDPAGGSGRSRSPTSGSSPTGSGFIRLLLVLLSIVGAYQLGARLTKSARESAAPEQAGLTHPQLSVQQKSPAEVTSGLAAVGYIVAERQAAVSSKATGRLKELRVREGDSIAAGEVVGTLENDDLRAALAGAEAQHGVALAQLEARRAERSDAMTAAARAARLYADKTLSVEAHDAAQLKVRVAQAAETAAEAAVSVAAAAEQRASAELEYTVIKAPFAGTVISKNAELGEIVAPVGSSASARAALVTIADLSSLLVEADISESAIMRVGIGTLCDIRLDASPDKVHHGTVVRIVPSVDRAKATVLTKIQLSSLTPDMLPEMSAKITCFPGKSLPTAQ